MKSGIKSMGLSAYAATAPARSFAYHGTRGSRAAVQTATTYCFFARAHCFAAFSTDRSSSRRPTESPAGRPSTRRMTSSTRRQRYGRSSDQHTGRTSGGRDCLFVCAPAARGILGPVFILVAFSGAEPAMRFEHRKVVAERPTRVSRLILTGKHGLTFRTVVISLPFIAGSQTIDVLNSKCLDS